MHEYFHLF